MDRIADYLRTALVEIPQAALRYAPNESGARFAHMAGQYEAVIKRAADELERMAKKTCTFCGDEYEGAGYGDALDGGVRCSRQCYHTPAALPTAERRK